MSRAEVLRRVVHTAIGLGAYLVPWLGVRTVIVLALVAVPANAWLLPRIPGLRRVIRPDGSGTRAIWLYPLTVALLLALFHDQPRYAQAGWLALAFGDGLAPFLAMIVSGPVWPWHRRKHVAVSVLAALIGGAAALPVLPLAGVVGVVAMGVVADSIPGEDNVTWPVLTAAGAFLAAPP